MANIHDVARLAGVSIKTVSRVINGEAYVSEETASKVRHAIEALQYHPHSGARSLRSSRSGLIAMITSAISKSSYVPYMAGLSSIPIVHGVQQTCRAAGRTLVIADSQGEPEDVAALLSTFRSHRVEGLIFSTDHRKKVGLELDLPFPVVLVNCEDELGTDAVLPDDYEGQRRVAAAMVAKGHSSIAMIGLPLTVEAGMLRRQAFIDVAAEAGIGGERLFFAEGSIITAGGEEHLLRKVIADLRQRRHPPSAVCFGNDLMAMRALPLLGREGFAIGRNLAIWGYDNDIAICEAVHPRLSTYALPYYGMGVAAAELLLKRLGGETGSGRRELVGGELIERESCAPPRAIATAGA